VTFAIPVVCATILIFLWLTFKLYFKAVYYKHGYVFFFFFKGSCNHIKKKAPSYQNLQVPTDKSDKTQSTPCFAKKK